MIYAMSDFHGCYDKFKEMLKLINFTKDDTLYILGDVVDRGENGLKILLEVMEQKNIVVLRGNHDDSARRMLPFAEICRGAHISEMILRPYLDWLSDGGKTTAEEFRSLNGKERQSVISYLDSLPFYLEITVDNKNFFLSHTGPEQAEMRLIENCRQNDFILGEIEYEKVYFEDRYFVSGHTPTSLIDDAYRGRIYIKNNHIAIDCGAVFGNPLGCICLDTMDEYYV